MRFGIPEVGVDQFDYLTDPVTGELHVIDWAAAEEAKAKADAEQQKLLSAAGFGLSPAGTLHAASATAEPDATDPSSSPSLGPASSSGPSPKVDAKPGLILIALGLLFLGGE